MNAYAPASSIGWLDLDADASERVGTLLRSLEEPGTIDVLGLGTVRDAFSAMLSPGTSTIETRLRYFIFLSWIFKRLEDQRVPAADFARRLRDAEAELIDCLRQLGPGRGVIGFRAGRNLRRMPSELYWGSMYAWGVRRLDLSIAQYGQRSAALGRLRPVKNRHVELCSWAANLPVFWAVLAGHSIRTGTQNFVNEVVRRAVDDPDEFAEDPDIHTLIRHRELRLKSKRARLSYRAALENWNQAPAGGQLDYRWSITKTYLLDIAAAGLDV